MSLVLNKRAQKLIERVCHRKNTINLLLLVTGFGLNIFISENNIHGNYNIVKYINIIGLEWKQYSLFGSSPKALWCVVLLLVIE